MLIITGYKSVKLCPAIAYRIKACPDVANHALGSDTVTRQIPVPSDVVQVLVGAVLLYTVRILLSATTSTITTTLNAFAL